MDLLLSAVLTVIGLAMLCFGGNWLVSGSVLIAKKFRINNLIIGMVIVAYGTSTPELAASIAAAGEHSAIILGNIVGSNIANIGMVVGIAAILAPLAIQKSVLRKEIPIMLGVSALLVLLSIDGEISNYDGVILLCGLGGFGLYTYRNVIKQRADNKNDSQPQTSIPLKSIGFMGIGIVLLYMGAILTVNNAVILAQGFGLSEKLVGLTVIAIGTSLPELITSVIAIKRGHTDIGIGNILGSNIYNILMIMGIGATLGGVVVAFDAFIDYAIMIVFGISLLIVLRTKIINRVMGFCLAAGYVAYLIFLFFR